MKILPATMTRDMKLSFPFNDCNSFSVQVRLLHQLGMTDMISLILSTGIDRQKFDESIWMPKKGRDVHGPTNLSSATGMSRKANTDLSLFR